MEADSGTDEITERLMGAPMVAFWGICSRDCWLGWLLGSPRLRQYGLVEGKCLCLGLTTTPIMETAPCNTTRLQDSNITSTERLTRMQDAPAWLPDYRIRNIIRAAW